MSKPLSSRHSVVSPIHLALAVSAVVAFIRLFNLGNYDSYLRWPILYHFPEAIELDWGSFCSFLIIAGGIAGCLACLAFWAARRNGYEKIGLIAGALSRAARPLLVLWLFPVLYSLGFHPGFSWLFCFLGVTALAAFLLGLEWPAVARQETAVSRSETKSLEDPLPEGPDSPGTAGSRPTAWPTFFLLILACLGFVVLFSMLTILQYLAGNLGYADSGCFAEALWNTLHGRFLYAHVLDPPMVLADHFSPIWLAVLPVYALFPRHETLFVLSAVCLAVSAVPLFLLALHEWRAGYAALCLAVAFLLHPAVQHEVSSFGYGIQSDVLALPFIAWACYSMRLKRWRNFWICILVILLCKETLAAVVFGLGLCLWFLEGDRWRGAAVMALSAGWFLAVTRVVLPWLKGGGEYWQMSHFYGHLGSSLWDFFNAVVQKVLLHSSSPEGMVFPQEFWKFMAQMMLPLGLLCLLSPAALLAGVPHFSLMLVGTTPYFFSIYRHFKNPLMVILFFAAAVGVGHLLEGRGWLPAVVLKAFGHGGGPPSGMAERRRAILRGVSACLLVSSFLHCYYFGPTPSSKTFEPLLVTLSSKTRALKRMKQRIGLDKSVAVTHRAAAHFTDRRQLYALPLPPHLQKTVLFEADYILLDMADTWPDPLCQEAHFVRNLLSERSDYRRVGWDVTFVLYEKIKQDPAPAPSGQR